MADRPKNPPPPRSRSLMDGMREPRPLRTADQFPMDRLSLLGGNIQVQPLLHGLVDPRSIFVKDSPELGFQSMVLPSEPNTIQAGNDISTSGHFSHELTHVLQVRQEPNTFQKALETGKSYDYGGPEALESAYTSGRKWEDFGVEQQASIVQDWVKLANGHGLVLYGSDGRPRYVTYEQAKRYLPLYAHFVQRFKTGFIQSQSPKEEK